MQLVPTTLLRKAPMTWCMGIVGVCIMLFGVGVARAEASSPLLDTACLTLFHLPSDTQTTDNPYLNKTTCAAYKDLLDRYANCARIQLDGISCRDAIVKLNPNFAKNLDAMLQKMTAGGYSVSIISATVNKPGTDLVGRVAVSSNHQFGCAADIVVSGWNTKADTRCTSAACRAAQQVAAQAGLRSLGYYPQFNHFQPTGAALALCQKEGQGSASSNALVASTLALSMPSFSLDETVGSTQSGYQSLANWTAPTPTLQPIAIDTQEYGAGSMVSPAQNDTFVIPTNIDQMISAESSLPLPVDDSGGNYQQTYVFAGSPENVAQITEMPPVSSLPNESPSLENREVVAGPDTPAVSQTAPVGPTLETSYNSEAQYPCWFGILYCPPSPVASAPIPSPLETTSDASAQTSNGTVGERVVASAPIPSLPSEPTGEVATMPSLECTGGGMPLQKQYPSSETWFAAQTAWFNLCYRSAR